MTDARPGGDTVVIKKYANRRLYNTATSSYVTLDDLAAMVREGIDFVVYDAKTNDDLTRTILTQIIFEEESRGEALLPVQFLRRLIGFYGGQMQGVLPSYLEMSLDSFSKQQEQFRAQLNRAFGTGAGAGLMEDAVRQNMLMFQKAMTLFPGFNSFARAGTTDGTPEASEPAPRATASETAPGSDAALDEMRRQMDEMRAQIDRLAQGAGQGAGQGGKGGSDPA
ncbi:polyhydroxyalkanoate synthesis repressor PhaR [Brevundimonas sp.]|uniref:polyhydroxyalkanoate synthesis repressor PhaR n=1 Tax=Brevundimonas sp. TaxID=1871086 RepID=UPI0025BD4E02|nr:polyhydroxyalkanoate synthesis repressor PhaR [Brevundimonas sp.]